MSLNVSQLAPPQGGSMAAPSGGGGAGGGSLPRLSTASATGNPRNKVVLAPGHSLMDWIRLGRTNDLAGTGGRVVKVTLDELAKHNTEKDAWIAIKDKVYNVTPYMDFHPGGIPEMMRGVGTDGTALFDEVHKWVNYESMLAKCYIGPLEVERPSEIRNKVKVRPSATSLTVNGLGNLKPPSGKSSPRYEWLQNESSMTIVVYTKWKAMTSENVIIDCKKNHLMVTIFVEDYTYTVAIELEGDVKSGYNVKVSRPSGKVEIVLQKQEKGRLWSDLGSQLPLNNMWRKTADREKSYRECTVLSVEAVSHDTNLYRIGLPEGTRMCVPLGHHVYVKTDIEGVSLAKPYTVVPSSLHQDLQDSQVTEGGVLYLMIKIYKDGALTPHIDKLKEGSLIDVSDHEGTFELSSLRECDHLVLCAAGTGFTPMAGLLLQALVISPKTDRKVHLLFFNKDEPDILWRKQLENLQLTNKLFKVTHILSQPNNNWTGPTGRIRQEILEGSRPRSGEETKVLFCACGPRAFTDEAVRLAKEFKYADDMIHAFVG